jgi:hypothetical protein
MKLSFKDVKFIIEAIENLIKVYEERLNSEIIDDDEISDIGNGCMFLEALSLDLANNLKQDLSNKDDTSSQDLTIFSTQDLMKPVLQLPINQRLILVDFITESIRQELSLSQK